MLLEPGVVHLDASATGTVTLDRPAPDGGTVVTLSLPADANEGEADFPATVTVPAGKSTADFTVVNKLAERRVPQATVRIIASAGGGTAEASVTLMGRLRVMAINLHAGTVTAGETLTGDVWVMGDNTRAATIQISFTGSLPNTEPVTVTIPEGRSEAVFPFSWTAPDVETTTQARVTAAYGDYFLDRIITVKAKPPVYADHVASITANPPSGTPFNDVTRYRVTITLTAPATKELPIIVTGQCLTVFSPNPVTIPQGATSQTLTMGVSCASTTSLHLYIRVNDAYANFAYPAA
ncbi:hypothetical protein ABGB12_22180 [Actinocorallia sp. B10E7]|uniref:hypothetical protein n=1 Tax=Actinocorallia sp. B10E7 TaxID=3153558 RepID=UPI00325EB609